MGVKEESNVEGQLRQFCAQYGDEFKQLAGLLTSAGISHYSSGCGNKRVTFDLFPASPYVEEFLKLLDLDRPLRKKMSGGFRDACPKGEYNPGQEFIMYMKRWSLFAEQVMQTEGDATRGIAAAQTKLLLDDLISKLSEQKTGSALKTTKLGNLMRIIAAELDARQRKAGVTDDGSPKKLRGHHNYLKALAAAQKKHHRSDILEQMAS